MNNFSPTQYILFGMFLCFFIQCVCNLFSICFAGILQKLSSN